MKKKYLFIHSLVNQSVSSISEGFDFFVPP